MDAYENVEPIVKPITLLMILFARAIKYNLQYKVKVSEAAIGLIEDKLSLMKCYQFNS